MTDTETEAPAAPASPAARRWPRRVLLGLMAGVAVVIALVHSVGGRTAMVIGVLVFALIVFAGVIWRLPHLRRHFARPGGSGGGSGRTPWRRGTGGKGLLRRGNSGLMTPGGAGSGGRRRGGLSRRSGPGRSGTLRNAMGRSGSGRNGSGRSGTGRGSLFRRGAVGRHSAPGRSLRHPFRGGASSGRGGGTGGRAGGRSWRHPFRRAATGGGRGGTAAGGPGRTWRHPFRRPAAAAGRKGAGPAPAGGSGRRPWRYFLPGGPWRRRPGAPTTAKPGTKPGTKPPASPSSPAVPVTVPLPWWARARKRVRKRYKKARKWAKLRQRARAAGWRGHRRVVTVTRHRKPPVPLAPRVRPRLRKAVMRLDAFRMRRWWKHTGKRPGRPMAPPAPAAVAAPVVTASPGAPVSPSGVLNGKVHPPSNGSTPQGRFHMWGKQGFAAVQEAVDQHIGQWDPDEAADIEEFFAGLPDYWREQGQTFMHLADRMGSELPIAGPVRELLSEVGAACATIGEHAEEVYGAHRSEHEVQLQRLENPQPGEEKWNIT